jgi:threonine aldolase
VCVEQTFMGSGNAPGGRVLPKQNLAGVRDVAREAGIPVHMDGARLWNAVVASGSRGARVGEPRGLGVRVPSARVSARPVGSLVASTKDFLERAKSVRKRLGGWMRQAGILAAAGLYALEHNVERLERDHVLARMLAERLHGKKGLFCPPDEIETNIVFVQVGPSGAYSTRRSSRRRSRSTACWCCRRRSARCAS